MKKAYSILLKGAFCQSGFGFSCMKRASELNIPGTLTYIDAQTVQIEAHGELASIDKLFTWCLDTRETTDGTCLPVSILGTKNKEFTIINSL